MLIDCEYRLRYFLHFQAKIRNQKCFTYMYQIKDILDAELFIKSKHPKLPKISGLKPSQT